MRDVANAPHRGAVMYAREHLDGLMDRRDLIDDPRFADNPARVANVEELDAIIEDWTRRHDTETLLALLDKADVPSTVIYNAADCAADPQYAHRGMVRQVEDPQFTQSLTHPGIVPKVTDDPGEIRWCGPKVGEHTDEIMTGAGFSADDIAALRERQVIA